MKIPTKTLLFISINLLLSGFIIYQLAFKSSGRQKSDGRYQFQSIKRDYSQAQVKLGEQIFQRNCAVCHQAKGRGADHWKQPLSDGSYPPPPLNGTGHTFHHSKASLISTINEGGSSVGGKMPGFKTILSQEEVEAVIAYFQSFWPDEIYHAWTSKN